MTEAEHLLHQNGIRITAIRTAVLRLFMQSRKAFTHADLERAFDNQLDRVSLYRCLLTLTEAGIIQKFIDYGGNSLYFYEVLTSANRHPHFKCSHCETIVCLPALPEAYLNALTDYQIDTFHLLVEGTCNACRQALAGEEHDPQQRCPRTKSSD
ncbi:Fur family transcriptional regulator [Spirosoma aerolatum]|uniref:Fur family transcriptional regulator n=1 Tax=Spirosoma aerolatum TaxID=1211326 RepID=UPI001472AE2F|nr:transcriptional repressor [Spirosoma aerolatum]